MGSRSSRQKIALLLAAAVGLGAATLPYSSSARVSAASGSLGSVRYIKKGLTVQAPHHAAAKGKVKQALYSAYRLQTKRAQKASIHFRDGTLLHLNQLTDATLRSASLTQVKAGEVEEHVVPGTNHQIQTAGAVASAIGTAFDIQVKGNVTVITVVEGAVLVVTPKGSVVVKSGEQVRVKKGQAPGTPAAVDTSAVTAWTSSIPAPTTPLGLNVALDANGGKVYAWSSQRDAPARAFDATNANDGRLDRGWQSAAGKTSNQWLRVGFEGGNPYPISTIFLDCAATGGQPAANGLKDFAVQASGSLDSGFQTVLTGTCLQQDGVQVFSLSSAVNAAYLELDAKTNWGGTDGIAVAELGAISTQEPAELGTPTPAPTDTATPSPTPTSTAVPTATPTPGPRGYMFDTVTNVQTFQDSNPSNTIVVTDTFSGKVCGDPFTAQWTLALSRDVKSSAGHNGFSITEHYALKDGSPTVVLKPVPDTTEADLTWIDGSPPQMQLHEVSDTGFAPTEQTHLTPIVPNPSCP